MSVYVSARRLIFFKMAELFCLGEFIEFLNNDDPVTKSPTLKIFNFEDFSVESLSVDEVYFDMDDFRERFSIIF